MTTTLRYRAESSIPYAHAIIALSEYARGSGEDFDFGPVMLDALDAQGLTVTGPDLELVKRLLDKVPGLRISDE